MCAPGDPPLASNQCPFPKWNKDNLDLACQQYHQSKGKNAGGQEGIIEIGEGDTNKRNKFECIVGFANSGCFCSFGKLCLFVKFGQFCHMWQFLAKFVIFAYLTMS